jgi:YesN/AraC family two-component response regulator
MDDFLAKPFNEEDLYEVVNRVLRKEGLFNQPNSNEDPDLREQLHEQPLIKEKLYDLKQVEEIALGNTEFILSLVNIFLVTIPLACNEMVEASKVDQWDKVSKLAHKLKSTIDTLDIACIRTDIRTIELDAKKEINLGSIKKLIIKVNKVIQATAEQLRYEFSA